MHEACFDKFDSGVGVQYWMSLAFITTDSFVSYIESY